MISSRVYNEQAEELLAYYLSSTTNPQGWMMLENFAPLARALLLMVYQNTYPAEVRAWFIYDNHYWLIQDFSWGVASMLRDSLASRWLSFPSSFVCCMLITQQLAS